MQKIKRYKTSVVTRFINSTFVVRSQSTVLNLDIKKIHNFLEIGSTHVIWNLIYNKSFYKNTVMSTHTIRAH